MPKLLSVNVGLPREIEWQGKPVRTGIWKFPVPNRVEGLLDDAKAGILFPRDPRGLHELTYQRGNLVCLGIKCKVASIKYINLCIWRVFAVPFRLAGIEREVMFSPEDQELWLCLL